MGKRLDHVKKQIVSPWSEYTFDKILYLHFFVLFLAIVIALVRTFSMSVVPIVLIGGIMFFPALGHEMLRSVFSEVYTISYGEFSVDTIVLVMIPVYYALYFILRYWSKKNTGILYSIFLFLFLIWFVFCVVAGMIFLLS